MADIIFGRSGKKKMHVVVDVGVGGASVSIIQAEGSASIILTSGHSALSFEARDAKQSITLIGQQVREAADMALKSYAAQGGKAPIEHAIVVVHAPWSRTRTTASSKHFDTAALIDESTIASLAKDALTATADIDTSRLLEASVTHIEIDGYHTAHPEGKEAERIDTVSLISDCESGVQNTVAAAISTLFPSAQVRWRSGARAIAAFLEQTVLKDRDVFVVDMSTDTSHLISMRGGMFQQSIVMEGVRTILARVAGGRLPDETLGHMRMLEREACSNEACEAIEKAMSLAEPELARLFGEAIAKMSTPRHVPNDLLLITHRDLQSWLGRFFTRIDFAQFTVTTLPFAVHTVDSLGIPAGEHQPPALAVDIALVNSEERS